MVWNSRSHGVENQYLQNNQTSGWSGTERQGKGKPGTGNGERKNKNKRKGKQHGKNVKKRFHEMQGHEDTEETQTGQYTEWTDTSWDHSNSWTDADC